MVLACHNLEKAFEDKVLITDGTFHIEDRDRAAIVGVNGAGKTTLLRIILGLEPADNGQVILQKGKTVGYLAQQQKFDSTSTIFEEVKKVKAPVLELEQRMRDLEARMKHASGEELKRLMDAYTQCSHRFEQEDGYAWKSQVTGVIKGLGFTDAEFDQPVSRLSGGEKSRVALCKLLLTKPDLLMLDEPTNHLDLSAVAWLENFLSNYGGAVIVVSHDRYFLDKLATKVIELEQGTLSVYTGNYTAYAAKREERRAAQLKAYLNQQAEIRHQEQVIEKLKSYNREKSIRRAESREKQLDKMERLEKPVQEQADMRLELHPMIESGKDVLEVSHVAKSFGDRTLFDDACFSLTRGEHIAIIGDNGTGKSTMLKLIHGDLEPDAGEILPGAKVLEGYYDQEQQLLHTDKSIFEELSDTYPELTNTAIRNVLAAFLFTGEEVFLPISALSGGERGRVTLAKLMLSGANLLLLDEPTNHLDMASKEILEEALNHFTGTVLYVSHDRYFINKTAHRILELSDGRFTNYLGNYDYYVEKKAQLTGEAADTAHISRKAVRQEDASGGVSQNKLDWKQQKEAESRRRRQENALKKAEEEISRLEGRLEELDARLADPAIGTDSQKLMELTAARGEAETALDEQMTLWEKLAEEMEQE